MANEEEYPLAVIVSPQFIVSLSNNNLAIGAAMFYAGTFGDIDATVQYSDLLLNHIFPDVRYHETFWSGQVPPFSWSLLTPASVAGQVELSRACSFFAAGTAQFSAWWAVIPVDFSFSGINAPTLRFGTVNRGLSKTAQSQDCPPPPDGSGGSSGGGGSSSGTWVYYVECTGNIVFEWYWNQWNYVGVEDVVCTSTPVWSSYGPFET